MKVAATLAAALVLGLVVAGCTSSPSATVTAAHGPNATVTAACESLLQIKVPPGAGQPHSGVGLAVVLSSQVKEDLIHSGNPKLAQDTRTMTNLIHPIGIDSALIAARTECRKVGVR
jgi:hypothetical protein